jgi:hypothetical protein
VNSILELLFFSLTKFSLVAEIFTSISGKSWVEIIYSREKGAQKG